MTIKGWKKVGKEKVIKSRGEFVRKELKFKKGNKKIELISNFEGGFSTPKSFSVITNPNQPLKNSSLYGDNRIFKTKKQALMFARSKMKKKR